MGYLDVSRGSSMNDVETHVLESHESMIQVRMKEARLLVVAYEIRKTH
jgi:hypothetical protein